MECKEFSPLKENSGQF